VDDTDATLQVNGFPYAATRNNTIDHRECDSVAGVLQKVWAELYKTEMPRLIRYLMKCFHDTDRHDAADAAHSAFAELFANWEKVRIPRAWLRKVAFRHMANRPSRTECPLDVLRREPIAGPASIRLEFRQETQDVIAALQQLPPAQRQVLALLYDQFSYSEIAQIMDTNEAAVRKNAERARRTMKELRRITKATDHLTTL
jgi:RNA polymerase sigma factor (sigma-70 family)